MSTEPYDASDSAVDAVILGSDSDCPRCYNPDYNEYYPRQPDQYAIGDICAIHETPNTPVHLVTHHTPPRPSTGGHGRPAVVVNSSRKAGRDTGTRRAQQTMCRICLLATFGHEGDITKLSQILQFFSLPVYPHHALFKCSRDPPHVHTSPEWCEHNTWLMAYIFNSRATISGRWKNRGAQSNPPSTYRVDSDNSEDSELCALIDACEQKLADWEKLLQQNPGLAEKWFQEYQKDHARIGKERSASRTSNASASRRRSGAVVRDGNTSTIPEVPPIPALPEGAAPSASAGDTTPYSPASSSISEYPVTLVPAHGLPNAIPRLDPGPSYEDVRTIAGLGNPAQPGTASVPAA